MILLHRWPTPKGKKVTILLEELGMPYNIVPCNIGKGDQFEPDFLKISTNNRMPAIVDHAPADGGPPISVFESGAIMMYRRTAKRMQSIEVRSWKTPMGRVLRRTSRKRRSMALVVLTALRSARVL